MPFRKHITAKKPMLKSGFLESAFPWLFAAIVAGYPLVSVIPVLFGLESRRISVPFRAAVLGLSLAVVLAAVSKRRFRFRQALVPLFVFWAFYSSRILFDTVLRPVELGRPPSEYLLFAFGVTFVPMLAFLARYEDSTLSAAYRRVLAVASVACAANSRCSRSRLIGSRAPNGSSMSMTGGSAASIWS